MNSPHECGPCTTCSGRAANTPPSHLVVSTLTAPHREHRPVRRPDVAFGGTPGPPPSAPSPDTSISPTWRDRRSHTDEERGGTEPQATEAGRSRRWSHSSAPYPAPANPVGRDGVSGRTPAGCPPAEVRPPAIDRYPFITGDGTRSVERPASEVVGVMDDDEGDDAQDEREDQPHPARLGGQTGELHGQGHAPYLPAPLTLTDEVTLLGAPAPGELFETGKSVFEQRTSRPTFLSQLATERLSKQFPWPHCMLERATTASSSSSIAWSTRSARSSAACAPTRRSC